MYISISDFAYFLGFCLLMTVGSYLVVVLMNLNKLISQTTRMVESNSNNIQQSMDSLPELMANLRETSSSIKLGIERTEATIVNIGDTVLDKVDVFTSGTSYLNSCLSTFFEIIQAIFHKKL